MLDRCKSVLPLISSSQLSLGSCRLTPNASKILLQWGLRDDLDKRNGGRLDTALFYTCKTSAKALISICWTEALSRGAGRRVSWRTLLQQGTSGGNGRRRVAEHECTYLTFPQDSSDPDLMMETRSTQIFVEFCMTQP